MSDISSSSLPRSIDGKYPVVGLLSRLENISHYETEAGSIVYFEVSTSAQRQQFYEYRTMLRSLKPAGLVDIVARPGAYYSVWKRLPGIPLSEWAATAHKNEETRDAILALRDQLDQHQYALSDAHIVIDSNQPHMACLLPVSRSKADRIAADALLLSQLGSGTIRPKQDKKPSKPFGWLAFVPGLLCWIAAGFFSVQATQIYLNPPVETVADVTGKNARTAAKQLTELGFAVDYTYGESNTLAVGAVIRQEPASGSTLPLGRRILLTVNNPAPLNVPKLEDLTVNQAQAPLKENALKLTKVLKVDGTLTNTPEGRIIAQVPPAGVSVQRGQPLQVLVSTGIKEKKTWIPDLTGMTYEQAREHARAAGLVVTTVKTEASDRPENTILRQDPKPFVRVDVGTAVQLVVATARFTPPSEVTTPIPIPPPYVPPIEDSSALIDPNEIRQVTLLYTFATDIPEGNYSITVVDAEGEREVMPATSQTALAGQEARATLSVRGNAVFIIRLNGAEYTRVNPL